jgi:hypothetical protein
VHHRAVSFFDALPAIIAVHGVIAAADAGNLADAVFAHLLLELSHVVDAAIRRRIAAIGEAMDKNARDSLLLGHAQQGEKVLQLGMNAAVADEAHQVELVFAATLHPFKQQMLAKEISRGDHLIDARDVHLNHAAGAHIHVTDFAIAHLSFGQANERAGGMDQRVREFLHQAVVIRLTRERNGIALCFRTIAPAVKNGKNDWLRTFGHG